MTILSPILLFMLLCMTTSKLNKKGNCKELYEIENELKFPEFKGPYKYIFLRLYDVDYNSALDPTNILKFGITCTEVADIRVSHASINFSLDDNFYALSFGGKYQVAKESCMHTDENKFMKKSDPETSNQITFALKVSEKDYYATKRFVEEYAHSTEVKYDVFQNFKIATFATKRKFFTDPSEQAFGEVKYPEKKKIKNHFHEHFKEVQKMLQKNGLKEDTKKISVDEKSSTPKANGEQDKEVEDVKEDDYETNFVCSTFVAYCLMKNVGWLRKWFKENKIDYKYVTVSDLSSIPCVVKLFSSKFLEYDEAVKLFIGKHPEFKEYYHSN